MSASNDVIDRGSIPSVWIDQKSPNNFFYQYLEQPSHEGIFIETDTPFAENTAINLIFQDTNQNHLIAAQGTVSFVNLKTLSRNTPNPGMGIKFNNLATNDSSKIRSIINRIAYL